MHDVHAVLARPGRRRLPRRRRPGPRQGARPARRPAEGTTASPTPTLNDTAENHEVLRGLRKVIDDYPGDRMLLGEVYLLSTRQVATYYGTGDELHLAFNFPPLYDAVERRAVAPAGRHHRRPHRPTPATGPRGCSRTTTTSATAAATAARRTGPVPRCSCCSACGARPCSTPARSSAWRTPSSPPDRVVDPGGRDGCRAPIPWTGGARPRLGRHRRLAAVAARRRRPQRRGAAGRRRLDPAPVPAAAGRPAGVAGAAAGRLRLCSTRPRACWRGAATLEGGRRVRGREHERGRRAGSTSPARWRWPATGAARASRSPARCGATTPSCSRPGGLTGRLRFSAPLRRLDARTVRRTRPVAEVSRRGWPARASGPRGPAGRRRRTPAPPRPPAAGGRARPPPRSRQPDASREAGSSRTSSSMSARVATSAGSRSASRASWLTQADASVTAGRKVASTPSRGGSKTWSSLRAMPSSTAASRLSAAPPRTWRESSDRTLSRSARDVGGRSAIATTARSGSTWRIGPVDCAWARRSRQAATLWATPRARPRRRRASLIRHQASSGGAGSLWRRRSSSHSSSVHVRRPRPVQLGAQRVPQVVEVGDVGGRVATPPCRTAGGAASRSAGRPWAGAGPAGAGRARRGPASPCPRTRRPPGCRSAWSGSVPQARSRISRSWLAACMRHVPVAGEQRCAAARRRRPAGRSGRSRRPSPSCSRARWAK